jgi:hypothetical protein
MSEQQQRTPAEDELDARRWRAFVAHASVGISEDGDLSIGTSVLAAEEIWSDYSSDKMVGDLPAFVKRLIRKGYSHQPEHVTALVDEYLLSPTDA